ncbi:energy transducer TonB [Stakelama tenebrarum]|uniref:Energy transducer TonB n=1 Tax=Stakelama tenebrarum TaxID=2711215 RepID=A0A6G6Y537_9SPHN|nr:energy transducer TonB [Sphingosinithalassobacter tenebrarum]QIG80064.1 energy transducer TonB [Sphingosinithalassobacter tenebrarum]
MSRLGRLMSVGALLVAGIGACIPGARAQDAASGEATDAPRAELRLTSTVCEGCKKSELISGSIRLEDYPVEARRNGEEGTVVVQFDIDTRGIVEKCRVVRSSGSNALDAQSCALIVERFRYKPARDSEGDPIAEKRTQTIRWEIEREVPSEPSVPEGWTRAQLISGGIGKDDYPIEARRNGEEGVTVVRYRIGTDGTVEKCSILQSSGSELLDTRSCALIVERFRYIPARNAEGAPVAETRTQPINWEIDWDLYEPAPAAAVTGSAVLTAKIGADGETRSCSIDALPELEQLMGAACESELLPPGIAGKLTEPVAIRLIMAQAFDSDPLPMPEILPGYSVAVLTSAVMQLDETGRVATCTITTKELNSQPKPVPCNPAAAPFRFVLPEGSERTEPPGEARMEVRLTTLPALPDDSGGAKP